jgi:UDP-N-acetylglucosamine 2-epimerase
VDETGRLLDDAAAHRAMAAVANPYGDGQAALRIVAALAAAGG